MQNYIKRIKLIRTTEKMGYDTVLPAVYPCKKIRAGKYCLQRLGYGVVGFFANAL